jgi:hypothetical protein
MIGEDQLVMHEETEQTRRQAREVKHGFRALIHQTDAEKQTFLQSDISLLTDRLQQGNELFLKVKTAQEAALDSSFLLTTASIAGEKLQKLHLGIDLLH